MSIIQFENGTKVNFDGNPTPEDVDFVAKQVGIVPFSQSSDQPQREQMKTEGQPVSVNQEKAKPSFGGKLLRGLGKFGLGIASTVVPPIKAAMGDKDPYAPIKTDYLGEVYSPGGKALRELYNKSGSELTPGKVLGLAGKGTLDIAGKGAELASYGVGGSGAVGAGQQLLKGSTVQAIKTGAIQGTKAGLAGGFGTGAQDASENAQTFGQGLGKITGSTALGGITGGALGTALPILGSGLSKLPKAPELIKKAVPKSENIMNRVARLTPTDAQKFQRLAGETHGDYLKKTGNFGTREEIVQNEAKKFTESLKEVDDALASLPGRYKNKYLSTALNDLKAREKRIGVASEETKKINNLLSKYKKGGLTMAESNEVKRLYERNVKLDFARQNLPEGIARSTRVDNGLRSWQFGQAEKLGFKNLQALNKQTQLSRFIVDKLGKQIAGKTGNNALNLTDWIMLSGGDPTAIGGFLAKKIFTSEGVQSGIAKMLSKGPVSGPIKAELTQTSRTVQRPAKLLPSKQEKTYPSIKPPKLSKVKASKKEAVDSPKGNINANALMGVSGLTGIVPATLLGKKKKDNKQLIPVVSEYVPKEYRQSVGQTAKDFNVPGEYLSALLDVEARKTPEGSWDPTYVNKGDKDTGIGQHTPNFIAEYGDDFKKKYGKEYDPKNPADNINMTGLAISDIMKKRGVPILDAILIYHMGYKGFKDPDRSKEKERYKAEILSRINK